MSHRQCLILLWHLFSYFKENSVWIYNNSYHYLHIKIDCISNGIWIFRFEIWNEYLNNQSISSYFIIVLLETVSDGAHHYQIFIDSIRLYNNKLVMSLLLLLSSFCFQISATCIFNYSIRVLFACLIHFVDSVVCVYKELHNLFFVFHFSRWKK